jgi:hypothetical protein
MLHGARALNWRSRRWGDNLSRIPKSLGVTSSNQSDQCPVWVQPTNMCQADISSTWLQPLNCVTWQDRSKPDTIWDTMCPSRSLAQVELKEEFPF